MLTENLLSLFLISRKKKFKNDNTIIVLIDIEKIKSIFEQYDSKLLKKKSKFVKRIDFTHSLINITLLNVFNQIEKLFEQLYDKNEKFDARLKTIAKNIKKVAKL